MSHLPGAIYSFRQPIWLPCYRVCTDRGCQGQLHSNGLTWGFFWIFLIAGASFVSPVRLSTECPIHVAASYFWLRRRLYYHTANILLKSIREGVDKVCIPILLGVSDFLLSVLALRKPSAEINQVWEIQNLLVPMKQSAVRTSLTQDYPCSSVLIVNQ